MLFRYGEIRHGNIENGGRGCRDREGERWGEGTEPEMNSIEGYTLNTFNSIYKGNKIKQEIPCRLCTLQ
jgi:hypothetical protein